MTMTQNRPALRGAKQLVTNYDAADEYVLTDHAIERMNTRKISLYEVLSTIVDPDSRRPGDQEFTYEYERGDVRVVVNEQSLSIITVVDLDEDYRVKPRVPLVPPKAKREVVAAKIAEHKPRVTVTLPETEEIAWLLGRHDVEDIRFMNVSPVIAAKLLSLNTRNRPKRKKDSDDWANQIVAGKWLTTHQGVALDRNMIILDGQHRLEAIVESGETVRMPVCVGLAPEVFDVIDTGRKRSAADVLAMRGETSVYNLAATTRLIYAYDHGLIGRRGSPILGHNDELIAYFNDRATEIRDALRMASRCYTAFHAKRTPASVAVYLLYRDVPDTAEVDNFFEGLIIGAELKVTDARWVLRRNFESAFGQTQKREGSEQLALFLKAWAAYMQDEAVRVLAFRKGESFPEVFIPGVSKPRPEWRRR